MSKAMMGNKNGFATIYTQNTKDVIWQMKKGCGNAVWNAGEDGLCPKCGINKDGTQKNGMRKAYCRECDTLRNRKYLMSPRSPN